MRARRYLLPPQPRSSPRLSKTTKISVTVDPNVLREVREVVHKEGGNLSSHISETLARDLRRRRLQQIIHDYERDHGAIGEREMRRIREKWKD